jgi:hypothetical protein
MEFCFEKANLFLDQHLENPHVNAFVSVFPRELWRFDRIIFSAKPIDELASNKGITVGRFRNTGNMSMKAPLCNWLLLR